MPTQYPVDRGRIFAPVAILLLTCIGCASSDGWEPLPPLPDATGVAGAFAGISGDALLVAGGANFPGKKPWEGGTKVWHETIWALDRPDGRWAVVGQLPRPLGYGVSVSHEGGLICAGGNDATGHYPDVFRLELEGGKVRITSLPPLPIPLANSCGEIVGHTLYVSGGIERPDSTQASRRSFSLNLSAKDAAWREVPPIPGAGCMLAVAAGQEGAFWVIGGVELVPGPDGKAQRRYLADAYRFDPIGNAWTRVADLPHPLAAAPSPAINAPKGPVILGGDDGSQIATPPDKHAGFSRQILAYDSTANRWVERGQLPAPRVTTPCVFWQNSWIVVSGEARPGVRSPEVWRYTPGNN